MKQVNLIGKNSIGKGELAGLFRRSISAVFLLSFALTAWAESWTDANGTVWDYNSNYGNCIIYGASNYPADIVIPDTVYNGTTAYEVKVIGKRYADTDFENKKDIHSIKKVKTISSIWNYVFEGCTALTTVDIAATTIGNYAFQGCTALRNVVLSGPTTEIQKQAFSGCTALMKIHLPSTLTTVGEEAFNGCTALEIKAPAALQSIGNKAFYGSPVIHLCSAVPPTISSVEFCNAKATVLVPDTLLDVYRNAAIYSQMASRILPESSISKVEVTVTAAANQSSLHVAVGESNLTKVVSLKVNGSINSYDIMVIRNKMVNLKTLDLSNASVVGNNYEYYTGYCSHDNMLEDWSFRELPLRVLYLPKNLVSIQDCCIDCQNLDSVYCQPGLQTIGRKSFYGCTSLKYVGLQEGLTEIGENAFENTYSLETITLPNSLSTIGGGAFLSSGLTAITIPANVQKMGVGAFACARRVEVYGDPICKEYPAGTTSIYVGNCNNPMGGGNILKATFAAGSKMYTLPKAAFGGQGKLQEVVWPASLDTIYEAAFAHCISLKNKQFPEKLKVIKPYAFEHCVALDTIVLPPHLETIESYAFQNCSGLDVIKISSSLRTIQNYAFTGCPNVSKVYTYTVEPTNILQQTFDCYKVADLYVPRTSFLTYYYNTQWSQFVKIVEFDEVYDYFYLNGDYTLGGTYGSIDGSPDVDINPGGGLIIVGDSTLSFGKITDTSTPETGSSILTDDNISIDTLELNYLQTKDKWHFLTFPFDINRENIHCNSEFVVRYYDGQIRATNGSGGWQNVPVGVQMKNAQGYIFQAAHDDTLRLVYKNPKLPNTDISTPLYTYGDASVNVWDRNWNMVGNPYITYLDIDSLYAIGFTYPVICWNGVGYDTYRPGDDTYHFCPLEGFFVQNATRTEMTFPAAGRETRVQAQAKQSGIQAAPARIRKTASNARLFVKLTLTDGNYTDKTSIVFNAEASNDYELGVDAAKLMSAPLPVQLFSIGMQGERYSINERPATTNGETIRLGYYAPASGTLTLASLNMDTTIAIYDNIAHCEVDLTMGDYSFETEAGMNISRFTLTAKAQTPNTATSMEELMKNTNGRVSVYTLTGAAVLENGYLEGLNIAPGAYIVKTENGTQKIVIR